MEFRRILVPHDGSKPSDKAMDTAIEFAKIVKRFTYRINSMSFRRCKYRLFLKDRYILTRRGETTTTTVYWQELYEEIKSSALKMLERWKLKCGTEGISAETRSIVGYPSNVTVAPFKRNCYDGSGKMAETPRRSETKGIQK